jgi:hypothetical protein
LGDATVFGGRRTSYESRPDGTIDELGHGALPKLHAGGQFGHGGALTTVGNPLDHEQEQVALRRESMTSRNSLVLTQEVANGSTKLGHSDYFLYQPAFHLNRSYSDGWIGLAELWSCAVNPGRQLNSAPSARCQSRTGAGAWGKSSNLQHN